MSRRLCSTPGQGRSSPARKQRLSHPKLGWAEQEPEDYWTATIAVIRDCLAQGQFADDVSAIGLSGLIGVALAVDRNGESLRPAIIWMDNRSGSECQEIQQSLRDAAIRRGCDNRIGPWYVEPKALWIRRHEPEIFRATYKYLSPAAFCVMRLTGAYVINKGDAGPFLAFDQQAERWDEALTEAIGLSIGLYPDIHESQEVVGEVTRRAAQETGLRPGTLVVAGGTDISSAALGVGVVRAGEAYYSMGTGANLGILMPKGQQVSERRILRWPHVVSGLTLFDAPMAFAGASLAWFCDQFGGPELRRAAETGEDVFDLLIAEAARADACSEGLLYLPYLGSTMSPHWNANATGVYFGIRSTTRREHFIRATMEGVAYDLASNIKVARAAGLVVNGLTVNGGPTRSRFWNQITANVVGLAISVTDVADAAPLGNAILAATGAKIYEDAAEAARSVTRMRETIEPDPVIHARYDDFFALWTGIYDGLRDSMARQRALLETLH
jgi:xylulokinase